MGFYFLWSALRRSAGYLGDKWHLDKCVISIAGQKQWLWRAVDQNGVVLDVLVQSRRNAKAARRLMHELLKAQGHAPRVMITDISTPLVQEEVMVGNYIVRRWPVVVSKRWIVSNRGEILTVSPGFAWIRSLTIAVTS